MTINISLNQLANLQNENTAVTQINQNSNTLTGGFTTALNTTGDQMLGTLDMNSNQIINLPAPATANSPVRLTDVVSGVVQATISSVTNSLTSDVALSATSTFFDGPSVAQGTTGTWLVLGTVTVSDTAGNAVIRSKLWDGTTIVASTDSIYVSSMEATGAALSGIIANPKGNLRISCRDISSPSGFIKANASAGTKDSTITAIRIA